MSNQDVLKSFLVSLGWSVDETGQRKFANAIAVQTEAVQILASSLKEVALKIIDFTKNTVESMSSLYFESQRTKASANNILALNYAAEQTGSSAGEMASSLQNLEEKIRAMGQNNAVQWMRSLGVDAINPATGKLKDYGDILVAVKRRMADLTAQGKDWQAKMVGDETGLGLGLQLADYDSFAKAKAEFDAKRKASGVDGGKSAKGMKDLQNQWNSLKADLNLEGLSFGVQIGNMLIGPLKALSGWFDSHQAQITQGITTIVQAFKPFGQVMLQVGAWVGKIFGGILKWFNSLSPETKKFIASFLLIAGTIAGLIVGVAALLPLFSAIGTVLSGIITIAEGVAAVFGLLFTPGAAIVLGIIALVALIYKFRHEIADFAITCWDKLKPALEAIGKILTGGFTTAFHSLKDLVEIIGDLIFGRWSAAADKAKDIGKNLIGYYKQVGQAGQDAINQMTGGPAPAASADDFHVTGKLAGVRGIRNNNPGNINFVGQEGATLENGPKRRFAAWKTAQEGLNALAVQLRRYAAQGINSVRAIVEKYAPAADGNDTAAYIKYVAGRMGNVDANKALNLGNAEILEKMMDSIIHIENGGNPYSMQMLAMAAQRAGASGTNVTINQNNPITVNGATDPAATGRAVEQANNKSNAQLARNLRGRVS